jgi:mRNA-degrading endonuclease RelE of RelBE toxin-antitoxin system
MNVLFARPSRKYLFQCEKKTRADIIEAIEGLPDRGDIKRLKGQTAKNTYRLRVGKYRIIYVWEGAQIKILDIDTRGDIYK